MPGSANKLTCSAFILHYPTHAHPSEFWGELGRTVATFGFLEDALVKAYFAITGTTSHEWETEEEAKAAREKWGEQLSLAMADTLVPLAQKYAAAVRRNKTANFAGVDALEASIKKAAESRNALCHGFRGMPGCCRRIGAFLLQHAWQEGREPSEVRDAYRHRLVAAAPCRSV